MLRFKQAMDKLKIPQQEFVKYSGWSKTQVSLTLNSGKLPVDSAKFASNVVLFALEVRPEIGEWVTAQGLIIESLLDDLSMPESEPAPDLERVLCEIAGRSLLCIPASEGDKNLITRLASVSHYLFTALRDLAGEDAPYMARVEAGAVGLLICNSIERRN